MNTHLRLCSHFRPASPLTPLSFTGPGWSSQSSRGMALVHPVLSDFVLFPREQSFFDSMPDEYLDDNNVHYPQNMDPDLPQDYSNVYTSSYTSHPTILAYSAQSSSYEPSQLVVNGPKDMMKSVQPRYTPSTSPSTSISHSLEHAPSVLSTASAQSTVSSAVKSSYSHTTQNLSDQYLWTDPQSGLCIAPSFDQNKIYSYPLPDLESEQIMCDSKYPGTFVGELQDISSTPDSTSYILSSPISSSSTSRSVISSTFPFPPPPMGFETSMGPRNMTIDTILEEANDKIGTRPSSTSPVSINSSVHQPPKAAQQIRSGRSPEGVAGFSSPVIPASPFTSRASSPFLARQHEPHRRFSDSRNIVRTQSTPPTSHRSHPYARHSFEYPTNQGHRGNYQTPFFNQSSGRFIPPLESSCWFSLHIHSLFIALGILSGYPFSTFTPLNHLKLQVTRTNRVFFM